MPEEKYAKIEKLGKYKIVAELGRGGMARVFKAMVEETGETVAVKALLPELAAQPSFVKRFRREIETLKGLEHPRIVRVLDVGEDAGYQFYVMEYMDGPTVEKQMRLLGKYTVPEALRVTRAVAEALEYAHAKGLIHRDIKPANIMTNSAGEVKLADFGIAKDIEATRLTVTGGIVGTADYMSPEQAEGRRVTRKSDVYSLGVCLYHMVTGRLPFVGKTYMDVIRAHRFTLPEPPRTLNPSLPPRVGRLIEMMMEKDPDKRLSSAREVLQLLDAVEETGRELTEEERESARDMVQWALVPEGNWRRTALRITGGIAIAVLAVVVAMGLRYRYFTTAEYKFELGREAYARGDYAAAKTYFEHVRYFHPDSERAKQAGEWIKECLLNIQENGAKSTKEESSDGMFLYEEAQKDWDAGKHEDALTLWTRLATHFADKEGGRRAAAKLEELAGKKDAAGEGASSTDAAIAADSGQSESGDAGVSPKPASRDK